MTALSRALLRIWRGRRAYPPDARLHPPARAVHNQHGHCRRAAGCPPSIKDTCPGIQGAASAKPIPYRSLGPERRRVRRHEEQSAVHAAWRAALRIISDALVIVIVGPSQVPQHRVRQPGLAWNPLSLRQRALCAEASPSRVAHIGKHITVRSGGVIVLGDRRAQALAGRRAGKRRVMVRAGATPPAAKCSSTRQGGAMSRTLRRSAGPASPLHMRLCPST